MKIKLNKSIAFFDVETTGLNISQDRIIEICIKKINVDYSTAVYYSRINPEGKTIELGAFEKHGISLEDLKNSPTFKSVSNEIFSFINNCDLGGYNCMRFDIPILIEEFMRAGINYDPRQVRVIDAYSILTTMESRKLEAVYEKYTGKTLENAHTAEADIDATIEIFNKQLEVYGEKMPSSIDEIDKLINEPNIVDYARRFKMTEDKKIIFNFGKYQGKTVAEVFKTDKSYFSWIINKSDMPLDTKFVTTKLLQRLENHFAKTTSV